MTISVVNREVIERISRRGTDQYLDLPSFFISFNYPVSLEISEWVGAKIYQKSFADPLEFLCIMANKFYTSISSRSDNILESFILEERKSIEEKTRNLILAVKRWEVGKSSDDELAEAITEFCRKTYAVRLPMASFFLRMLLPEKFGTVDFRCINALRSLGFEIKDLPPETMDKDEYLERYNGFDYLQYNELLTEIGRHYQISSKLGGTRHMFPSEVDMALYQYDKMAGKLPVSTSITEETSSKTNKIQRIMETVEKIVEGTRTGPAWVKKAGESLLRSMKNYAANNDLDSMFKYYARLAEGKKGKRIARWLEERKFPSIESEYEKIKSIYYEKS